MSLLLTALLILITGYYTYVTHKLLYNEKYRRNKEIRPVITFSIVKLIRNEYEKSQNCEIKYNFILSYRIKNYNQTAINFNQRYSFPHSYEYIKGKKKVKNKLLNSIIKFYELIVFNYSTISKKHKQTNTKNKYNQINYTSGIPKDEIFELNKNEIYNGSIEFYTHDINISKNPNLVYQEERLYFIVNLTYEDLDQNKYFHKIFFSLWMQNTDQKNIFTSKAYEEIDIVENHKMNHVGLFEDVELSRSLLKRVYWK